MKNNLLLLAFVLISFTSVINAQTNVWFDNFESYTENQNLASASLYEVWNGSSNAWITTNHVGSTAFSGSKFAYGVSTLNWQIMKTLLLTAGKSYVFEVYTKGLTNHQLSVQIPGEANKTSVAATSPDWTKRSISFTVPAGKSSTVVLVYQWNNNNPIMVDDFRVYEDLGTSINSTLAENDITISTIDYGKFELNSQNSIASYKIFTLEGRLLNSKNSMNSKSVNLDMSNYTNNVFIIKVIGVNGVAKTFKLTK